MFWIPHIYGISPSDCPTLISRCLSIHGVVVHLRIGFLLFKQIMVICGNILTRDNYEHFVLTCAHKNDCFVEMELERWREFILHIKEHLRETHPETQEFAASGYISTTESDCSVAPAKVFIIEQPQEDCLAEDMFVDLPASSEDEDGSEEEDEDEVDCSSMAVDCELGSHDSTNFAPLSKVSNYDYQKQKPPIQSDILRFCSSIQRFIDAVHGSHSSSSCTSSTPASGIRLMSHTRTKRCAQLPTRRCWTN